MPVRVRLSGFACAAAGREAPGKGDDSYSCTATDGLALAVVADGASSVEPRNDKVKPVKSSWASGSLAGGLERIAADLEALQAEEDEVPYSDLPRALHLIDYVVSGGVDLFHSRGQGGRRRTLLGLLADILLGRRGAGAMSASTLAAVVLKPSWAVAVKAGDSHLMLHFVPEPPGEEADAGDWRSFLLGLARGGVSPLPVLGEESMVTLSFRRRRRGRVDVEASYESAPAVVLTGGALAAAYVSGYRCLAGVVASDGALVDSRVLALAPAHYKAAARGQGSIAYYVPDPPLNENVAAALTAYPWLGEGVAKGLGSLARGRPYTALELTLSHLIAAAACHALSEGRPGELRGLLEAVVDHSSRKSRDDASIAVAFAAIASEAG